VPRAPLTVESRGYGEAFLRPVFHGVGMEHEEAPIPGGHSVIHGEEKIDTVETGMTLAIGNCWIYHDEFGVRVEDTIVVGDTGPGALTSFAKA
jgi:Xaa-Pro dipeptidase